jgi:hypothetical protein
MTPLAGQPQLDLVVVVVSEVGLTIENLAMV